jgi:hypothetical protein
MASILDQSKLTSSFHNTRAFQGASANPVNYVLRVETLCPRHRRAGVMCFA